MNALLMILMGVFAFIAGIYVGTSLTLRHMRAVVKNSIKDVDEMLAKLEAPLPKTLEEYIREPIIKPGDN